MYIHCQTEIKSLSQINYSAYYFNVILSKSELQGPLTGSYLLPISYCVRGRPRSYSTTRTKYQYDQGKIRTFYLQRGYL